MGRVSREHFAILIQPYVRASEYRVFVLNGLPLFSYQKTLPFVRGDDERTLAELVAALPRGHEEPSLKVRGRDHRGKKVEPRDVVDKNTLVFLEGAANRAAGGGATDIRDGAPRKLGDVALAATQAVGLALSAVDIFVSGPYRDEFTVIEVNSNPMIATLEDNQRWHLIIDIWRANFEAAFR